MDEEVPTFDIDWEDISYEEIETISIADLFQPAEKAIDSDAKGRFPEVNNEKIDEILEGSLAKATKYATNCHIKVFKGKVDT